MGAAPSPSSEKVMAQDWNLVAKTEVKLGRSPSEVSMLP